MQVRSGEVGSPVNHFPQLRVRELLFWSFLSHHPSEKLFNSTQLSAMVESYKSCYKQTLPLHDTEWASSTWTRGIQVSSQSVLHLLKKKREQISENWPKGDNTWFSPLSLIFYQATEEWMICKVYIFVVFLPFQGDVSKIWTEELKIACFQISVADFQHQRNTNLSVSYALFPLQIMKNKNKELK